MKITVVGTGYVGLSLAVLLAQDNEVHAIDINNDKIERINKRMSPIEDEYIEVYFKEKELNLSATDTYDSIKESDLVIIATPTNYDDTMNTFDTRSIESTIDNIIEINREVPIIIKSTIPVGYTTKVRKFYKKDNIYFSPEFLREGKALYDNLYPSRIIVGDHTDEAKQFAELLRNASLKDDVEVLFTGPTEAESIKLFANTYLALRVSFFNELDSFAEVRNLNSKEIIEGVGLDPRIGSHYNNPSFGYGGYCLPKDTKQLLANYEDIPQNIMTAIVEANNTRKKHVVDMIISKNPQLVGVFRLTMKSGSDNFRESAIQTVMDLLTQENVEIIIYEPSLDSDTFEGYKIVNDLAEFKQRCDLIIANRKDDILEDVKEKVYSRDIFIRD